MLYLIPCAKDMSVETKIAELQTKGFCVLKAHFSKTTLHACENAFRPIWLDYLARNRDNSNRGPHRHFLVMPFQPPCFAPEFFFDADVLRIVQGVMDSRIVADQWSCDIPVKGSEYQSMHVDYQRPLFPETPDLLLPTYMLVVSFGLLDITSAHGPIEIAPGTHRMPRNEAMHSVEAGQMEVKSVPMQLDDVLIRHPWALHRGTPNLTDTPRTLCTNQPQLSMGLLSSAAMLNQQMKEGPTIDHDNVVIASQSF